MPTSIPMNERLQPILRRRLSNHPQIVGDHTPTNPAFHPVIAVIAAARQAVAPFQPTDPAFDPRPPIAPTPEPALPLVRDPFGRLRATRRHPDLSAHFLPRIAFVRICRQLPVARQQARRLAKHLEMMIDARWQLFGLIRVAGEHGVAADNGAVNLVQPYYSPKFGVRPQLAFADDRRVQLE